MKCVVQRVTKAQVTVENTVLGSIDSGLLLLVGFSQSDNSKDIEWMARKITKLRIFEDDKGKMNLDLSQVNGSILAVSQFTLYADCIKGNRPSFTDAARPEIAEPLFILFCEELRKRVCSVQTGQFGAKMEVKLINDGPVTILLESDKAGER